MFQLSCISVINTEWVKGCLWIGTSLPPFTLKNHASAALSNAWHPNTKNSSWSQVKDTCLQHIRYAHLPRKRFVNLLRQAAKQNMEFMETRFAMAYWVPGCKDQHHFKPLWTRSVKIYRVSPLPATDHLIDGYTLGGDKKVESQTVMS